MKHIKVTSQVKPLTAIGSCDSCMDKMERMYVIFGVPGYDKAVSKCSAKTGEDCSIP